MKTDCSSDENFNLGLLIGLDCGLISKDTKNFEMDLFQLKGLNNNFTQGNPL